MRETMQEAWNLVLADPDFEFLPYYLGALVIATIFAARERRAVGKMAAETASSLKVVSRVSERRSIARQQIRGHA